MSREYGAHVMRKMADMLAAIDEVSRKTGITIHDGSLWYDGELLGRLECDKDAFHYLDGAP